VYWTYMGWNSPLSLGAELKEPAKVIPRVMIFGPLFVMAIYFLFAFVFISVIPYHSIVEGKIDPYFLVGKHFLFMLSENPTGIERIIPTALSFLIALLVLGNVNSTIVTGSRVSVALARDGILPQKIGHLDRKRKTPVYSLAAQSLWVMVLIFFIKKDSDLLNFSFIAITFLSVMTVFSVFIFRLKKEQKLALYRTYLYPFTPLFYIICSACILISVIINYVFEKNLSVILYSIISILAGLLFFEIWKRVNRDQMK
ncbi:MAG: APC family permease, partial [Leptospira sp.]|nr:APC family permease [Leptospira sp.]